MKKVLALFVFGTALLASLSAASFAAGKNVPEKSKTELMDPNPAFTESNCPQCHSQKEVVPIVYGYPSEELMSQAERGEVILGGCILTGNDPHSYCRICRKSW